MSFRDQQAYSGSAIAEYSTDIGCFRQAWGSVETLLAGSTKILQPEGFMAKIFGQTSSQQSSSQNNTLGNIGAYRFSLNQQTGMVQIVKSTTGQVVHATSIDGDQMNILGTMRVAATLESLAGKENDPETSAWLGSLAKLSYYSGLCKREVELIPDTANSTIIMN